MLIRIQWDNLMKKVNIYIHTWKVNNWREILNEQLSHIDDSGLGDTASVHICNLDFECKTQLDMWEHSKINDSYYLYLHNLGISWQGTKYEDLTANWRKWIMNGVVGNWKDGTWNRVLQLHYRSIPKQNGPVPILLNIYLKMKVL